MKERERETTDVKTASTRKRHVEEARSIEKYRERRQSVRKALRRTKHVKEARCGERNEKR